MPEIDLLKTIRPRVKLAFVIVYHFPMLLSLAFLGFSNLALLTSGFIMSIITLAACLSLLFSPAARSAALLPQYGIDDIRRLLYFPTVLWTVIPLILAVLLVSEIKR